MKKKALEIKLQRLQGFTNPKASLEQYLTPANIAAEILFFAHQMGDIEGKIIADLGSGPGIFSIGACFFNPTKIYAVEIDGDAIEDLKRNIATVRCEKIEIVREDVKNFGVPVDTIFQNTPFGAQVRHNDLPFLETSLRISKVIYTLHNWETKDFLMGKIEELGGRITHVLEFQFQIPRIYKFHTKEKVTKKFVFFRIEKVGDKLK